jgi:F-type H+-transporting ATPase subunit delta
MSPDTKMPIPGSHRSVTVRGATLLIADDKPTFWDRVEAGTWEAGTFAVLDRVGTGPEVRNLVGVLIGNRRLALLPQVAAAFGAQLAARRGQQVAEVISAHALTDTQRAQIAARLTEAGYSGVKLKEQVDPSILGGLIVRIGSRLYDNSIKSKLQRLQYAMKGAA